MINWWCVCFIWLLEYLTKKFPVATKQQQSFLIKVVSCNTLFRMLLVCIHSYLKSVWDINVLVLGTYRCMCTHTRRYIHTYTHTYIHTYIAFFINWKDMLSYSWIWIKSHSTKHNTIHNTRITQMYNTENSTNTLQTE